MGGFVRHWMLDVGCWMLDVDDPARADGVLPAVPRRNPLMRIDSADLLCGPSSSSFSSSCSTWLVSITITRTTTRRMPCGFAESLRHLHRVFLRKYLLRAQLTRSGCRPAAGHAPKSPSRTRPLGLKRLILRGRGNLAPNRQVTQELLELRLHAQPLLPYSHHVPASLSRISPMATLVAASLSTINYQPSTSWRA